MGIFDGGADFAESTAKAQQGMQSSAWDQSQSYLNQLRSAFSQYLGGNVGFDPRQLQLMRSAFLNKAATGYQNAGQQVRAALARSGSGGGDGPVGGDYTRGIAALEGGQADTVAGGLANIDLSNLQQMLQNKFNAGQLLQGNAAQIGNWGQTFTSGMNNAMNAYIQGKANSFSGKFGSNLGASLGQGVGSMATGGMSNLAQMGGGGGK